MGMRSMYILIPSDGNLLTFSTQNYNNPGDQCDQQDVVDFMNATQSFMDETEWVERYAWFGAMKDMSGVNQVGMSAQLYRKLLTFPLVRQPHELFRKHK